MSERCSDCGGWDPYPHNPGCLTLARIQQEQLREWRAAGGHPDPARWAAREADIERLLEGASSQAKRNTQPYPKGGKS